MKVFQCQTRGENHGEALVQDRFDFEEPPISAERGHEKIGDDGSAEKFFRMGDEETKADFHGPDGKAVKEDQQDYCEWSASVIDYENETADGYQD